MNRERLFASVSGVRLTAIPFILPGTLAIFGLVALIAIQVLNMPTAEALIFA